jgi:hypothetical protein
MPILTMLMLGFLILMGTIVAAAAAGIWFYTYYRRRNAALNATHDTLEELTDAADAPIKPPVKRKTTRKETP